MKEPLRRTKVVIRHLPPSVTQSFLFSQIDDRFSDRYNWFSFRLGKSSHKHQRYSRAYINFKRPEDVFEFAEFFDGHVFVNEKGTQFKAIVEYAPSQRVPKPGTKKDGREGTIFKDPDYLEFLKLIAKPVDNLPSAEIQLERKEVELSGAPKETPVVTPLMEFVRQKRAAESGTQGPVTRRKIGRKAGAASTGKSGSSSKRGSEKKKYILKDSVKGTHHKDKSKFFVASKQEDQPVPSVGKEKRENGTVYGIDGPVTGITLTADSGKKKILLLKPKDQEAPHVPQGASEQQGSSSPVANSPGSTAPKQSQRREAGGRLIRSILLSNEASQNQPLAGVKPQQKTQTMNLDNVKRPPRPANTRLGMHGHVSNNEIPALKSDGDKKGASNDKFIKKGLHGSGSGSEKHEKRIRNKDRLDRGVWAPLRGSDVSQASEERFSPSMSQSAQASSNSIEGEMKGDIPNGRSGRNVPSENGSNRHFDRRSAAYNIKDDGSVISSESKSSKRGATGSGAHEKQIWVQKSSSGS
ncbi:PREDICTED: regulator of nonsense transcripts UPF3 isoform X1 [Theobroma cacao]|uniref:Regulator of nonsense transcripts UPF3 isoform X1 n=1 Tax=Theobroma cacao TaxID=3641 RepID=A0AB32WHK5_THECC|nr:PREDICTED: regulator of nonsense transcripts UPF3 isoform X1 [Theobroma cacao]XP_017978863.1 PREDICTED: regulator of nonsense transcripts UPF3 isoform X1 [Theobroma cacao]